MLTSLLLLMSVSENQASVGKHHYKERISIKHLFDEARAYQAFPGGCVAVGDEQHHYVKRCYGWQTYAKRITDKNNSLFDLASLTKIIATTTAIMLLYDAHKLALTDKVVDYLPVFKGPNPTQTKLKAQITLEQLLTHSSGLPADNYVYSFKALYQTPVVVYPGQRQIYSDINFILLAKIVERITHQPFAKYVKVKIFEPLRMHETGFKPDADLRARAVPTEYLPGQHRFLKGVVHDPTARHLGGVAGHAGLFSTLNDLTHFAQMLLHEGQYQGRQLIRAQTIRLFTRRAKLLADSSRALGWDTAYQPQAVLPDAAKGHVHFDPGSLTKYYALPHQFSAGQYIDAEGFGHTGYTGVSLWLSRKHGLYFIILTNRVFPLLTESRRSVTYYWPQRIASALWRNLGFTQRNQLYALPKPQTFMKEQIRWTTT